MKKSDGFSFGWMDTSINALLRTTPELAQKFEYVLVTSVDSSRDLAVIDEFKNLVQRNPKCRFLGEGVVLPSVLAIQKNVDSKLFTGFDEIWWFEEEPTVQKPTTLSLVAPLNLETQDAPSILAHWMGESKCKLGLGDGVGLNFATSDEAIVRMLEQSVAR